jgi:hypothetical protein
MGGGHLQTEAHVHDDGLGVAQGDPHGVSGDAGGPDIHIELKVVVPLVQGEGREGGGGDLVVILLELISEQGRGVLDGHLHDHVPVHHFGDQFETVVAEVVIVAEEKWLGYSTKRRLLFEEFLRTERAGMKRWEYEGSRTLSPWK